MTTEAKTSMDNSAMLDTAFLYGANAAYIEQLYAQYAEDPTSVTESLRVVRCSRRTPRWASSSDTRRDRRDLGIPKARPAAAKPPRSTTSAKYSMSLRSCMAVAFIVL